MRTPPVLWGILQRNCTVASPYAKSLSAKVIIMPKVGDTILHYQVLAHLGKGGMGDVYKALDTRLGREVALKFVLHQDQLRPEQKERLMTEAKAIARFQHPNIAQIYAIEDYGEDFFLAMAFYEGESLDKSIARQTLPLYIILEIFEQLLEGLGHAHSQGIIHRDIKPANIFVTSEGVVKVLDFGTAHIPGSRLTQQQQWLGSLDYMPPEQFKHERVDIRSDIWSLGVLLFELLTGHLPFKGEFPQIMLSILKDNPQPLARFVDAPALQDIIECCLSKDKEDRFDSCQALLRSLNIVRANYHDSRANLANYFRLNQQEAASGSTPHNNQLATLSHPSVVQKTSIPAAYTPPIPAAAVPAAQREELEPQPEFPPAKRASSLATPPPRPQPTARNTLQRRKANLIGRGREIRELVDLLLQDITYLVTLTGLGGAGKTSLAQSVMLEWQVIDAFPDGQFFIDLGSLQDVSRFSSSLAHTLSVRIVDEQAWDSLFNYLGNKRLLLILDNLEHLLPDIIPDIERLLESCRELSLLVTSREVLNLPDEVIYDVQGLSLPPDSSADFYDYGATALFINRAQRLKRSFNPEKEGVKDAILDICRHLEGWPLGIELAVAWIRQLTPSEIANKLHESLDFLSARARTRNELPRHRSARAAFDYSWQMLSVEEKDTLAKLAVFHNRFTLRGGNEVAGLDLPMVASLVDKSLLAVRSNQSYSRHPLILEFCEEKLQEREDKEAIYNKHAHYFLGLLRDASQQWRTAKHLPWLNRVDRDIENIYKALTWFHKDNALLEGLELAALAAYPCRLKNYHNQSRHWLETFLGLDSTHLSSEAVPQYLQLRGDALYALTYHGNRYYASENEQLQQARALYQQLLAMPSLEPEAQAKAERGIARCLQRLSNNYVLQGKVEESQELAQESLSLFKKLHDTNGIADVLASTGVLHYRKGEYSEAQQYLHEAYSIYAANEDIEHTARTLHRLGNIALDKGKFSQAQKHYEESIVLREKLGDEEYMALSRINIGYIHQRQGDYAEAEQCYDESLEVLERIGSDVALPWIKNNLASIYHMQGDSLKAERFFHESLILSRERNDRQQIAWILQSMANMKLDNGVLKKARVNLKESLEFFQEFSDRYGIIESLQSISRLAVMKDEPVVAVKLMAAVQQLREEFTMPLEPMRAMNVQEARNKAKERLGEERFQTLWNEYDALPFEDAIAIGTEFLKH